MANPKLIGISGGWAGPYHLENNTFNTASMLFFLGGSGTLGIDVHPTGTIRRNWLRPKLSWVPSEACSGRWGEWSVIIDATRLVVNNNSPFSPPPGGGPNAPNAWGAADVGPKPGGVMYEMATGIARRMSVADLTDNAFYVTGLADPWPTQPPAPIKVMFQVTSPDSEISPLVYNSGLETPMPTATTMNGSRTVNLSAALPQAVADEITAGHTLYFYLNNTSWFGDVQGAGPQPPNANSWTQAASGNGWGFRQGVTRASCKRKKIVAVAANRLSFTTDSTQNAFTANETFPYSVVRFDGLWRPIFYHGAGSWEIKHAVRWLYEGNIDEQNTNRCYAVDQPSGLGATGSGAYIGNATIVGNDLTWLNTDWGNLSYRYYYGAPWPFISLVSGTGTNEFFSGGPSRIVDYAIDGTHLKLHPVDPRYAAFTAGDCVNQPFCLLYQFTPWVQMYGIVYRYNMMMRGMPLFFKGEASYTGKVIRGGQLSYHDNFQLRLGDYSWPLGNGADQCGITVEVAPPQLNPGMTYSPGGAAVYDEPPTTAAQGGFRYDHNTSVRLVPNQGNSNRGSGALIVGASPIDIGVQKAQGVSVRDNVVVGANGVKTWPVKQYTDGEVTNTATSWDPATTIVAGNVMQGQGSLQTAFAAWNHAGTNACVADVAALGLPNYADGATDGFNLANYAFDDVYATGTVAIAANGLDVTLEGGGTFPTTVRRGQGFRVIGNASVPIAQGTEGVLSGSWAAYTGGGAYIKSGGAAPTGPDLNVTAHTTSLPNDQWVQATINGDYRALLVRWATTNVRNGYYGGWAASAGYFIYRTTWDTGTFVLLGSAAGTPPTDAVIALEVQGTRFQLKVNGATVVDTGVTGDTTYPSGRIGLFSFATPNTRFTNLTAGGFSAPGVRAAATITDAFSSATATISLASPYPIANVPAQAYAIGFKFAATDGTDPGADLTTLGLMTAGVRNAARAYD